MLMPNSLCPPHPGAFIQEIYLGPSNYSGRELALALGVAASTLNRLLLGQSGLSPEMALRLSKTLGRSRQLAGTNTARSAIQFEVNNSLVVGRLGSTQNECVCAGLREGLCNIALPSLNHAAVTRDYLPALAVGASPYAGISDTR